MKSILERVKNIDNSEEKFEFNPSKELLEFCNQLDKDIEFAEREFDKWRGWTPKLWYRAFYNIANKIHPHKPSQKESLYIFSPRYREAIF